MRLELDQVSECIEQASRSLQDGLGIEAAFEHINQAGILIDALMANNAGTTHPTADNTKPRAKAATAAA